MGMWIGSGKDDIIWDGIVKARAFEGDGSRLTGVTAGVSGSGSANRVTLWSGANTLTYSDNLFFDSTNKRLAIGNSNPSYAFEVASATSDFKVDLSGSYPVFRNTTGYYLGCATDFFVLGGKVIRVYGSSGVKDFRQYHDNSNGIFNTISSPAGSGGGYLFMTNTSEKMRLTEAGNLGIGDSSPSYKLDVTGDINATVDYYTNGTKGETTGGSVYYVGGSSTQSFFLDADGDGVNDTWVSIPTQFSQISFQSGLFIGIT